MNRKKKLLKRKVKIEVSEEFVNGATQRDYVEVEQIGREDKLKSIKELGEIARNRLLKQGENDDTPFSDEIRFCPKCGSPLEKRLGKYGMFLGCRSFPQCRYSRSL